MLRPGLFFSVSRKIIPGTILLFCATLAAAQHHGGAGHGAAGAIPGGISRPDGVDEADPLKDFHHALAVQATSQQIAEFQELVKSTSAAKDKLHAFTEAVGRAGRVGTTALDQTLEDARTRSKKFQDGFSESQKSGLKDLAKRLEKADSDLEQELKRLDQIVQSESSAPEVASRAASLDQALTDFTSEQLALGREMGIVLATGQDLAFNLPKVRNRVNFGSRTIAVDISGSLSQTQVEGDLRTFQLETTVDLSELQQGITEILNAQLPSRSCGARLAVKRATIMAAAPASSVVLQLHYERWSCNRTFGQSELAESDGAVEIKLIPAVDQSNGLSLTPEFKRIDATGMMADDLRSGDLGNTLRDKVASSVFVAVQAGSDFKATLPAALQNGVTLHSVRFQDPSGSGLKAFLQGQVRLSNEQVDLLASQLNQTLSAQHTAASAQRATSAPGASTQ